MAAPQLPEPVKLFVALLWSDTASLELALVRMTERWGTIDFQGPDRPFDMTDYYESEMGLSLGRRLISFTTLIGPDALAGAKLACNEIEDTLAIDHKRCVNLDVGYLDHKIPVGIRDCRSFESAEEVDGQAAGIIVDHLAGNRDFRVVAVCDG